MDMRTPLHHPFALTALGAMLAFSAPARNYGGEEPVAVRAEHFTVPPSTGPVTHVVVQNLRETAVQATVRLKLPEGWRVNPPERLVTLKPRETARVPFAVERAANVEANSYPVEITAACGDVRVVRKQDVVCASAPFFKPKIDGKADDWEDAIPVTYVCGGRKSVVRTYWNRSHFCLLVEVEEDKLIGYRKRPEPGGFDAVQFALAPRDARTGTSPSEKAARYEFLIAASGSARSGDKCFLLIKPGESLSLARERRGLGPLELKDAQVAVRREKSVTRYECAVPFSAMPAIEPTEGRELCFSLLVHDPDGTGLRDWGEAAGLWPWQRSWLAWCSWEGVQWGREAPFDNAIEWGLCSSKH